MRLDKNPRQSLKEQLVDALIERMLSGEFPAGERLPSERDLSEKFGISRNVVRVALSELITMGMLRAEARRGNFVTDYVTDGNLLILDALVRTGGVLPPRLFRSLLDLRKITLTESSALCALRRDEKNIAVLEALLNRQDMVSDNDNEELTELDFLLHRELCLGSGNLVYPMFHNSTRLLHRKMAREFYSALPDKREIRAGHRAIFEAIENGDSESARAATLRVLELGDVIMEKLNYLAEARSKTGLG